MHVFSSSTNLFVCVRERVCVQTGLLVQISIAKKDACIFGCMCMVGKGCDAAANDIIHTQFCVSANGAQRLVQSF
jgi:hypothetical protein